MRRPSCPDCGSTIKHHIAKFPCTTAPHGWHFVLEDPPQRSLDLVYQPDPGEVLAALKELAIAYRRATGLDGAYDPAIRKAERILTSTTSGV